MSPGPFAMFVVLRRLCIPVALKHDSPANLLWDIVLRVLEVRMLTPVERWGVLEIRVSRRAREGLVKVKEYPGWLLKSLACLCPWD